MGLKARLKKIERQVGVGAEIHVVWIEDGMTKEEAWRARYGEKPKPARGSPATILFLRWMPDAPPSDPKGV